MRVTPKLLALLIFTFASAGLIQASTTSSDIYIAQNAVGANSGADCANAHAASWFNTAANWGTGAGQIGPGTTVHICGRFTGSNGASEFIFQGGGTSANPITLLFDSGATLSAGYWGPNGAISTNGHSYIVIDGGTECGWVNQAEVQCNGSITATSNGSNLSNQQPSIGVEVNGGSSIEIRNLSIANMFVQTANQPTAGWSNVGAMAAIDTRNTSNVLIHNNFASNAHAGYQIEYNSGTTSNVAIYNNVSQNMCAGYTTPSGGTSPAINGILIHDNESFNGSNWDAADNSCHEDHFHGWAEAGGNGGTISGMQIYNNFFHGDLGCHQNGYIYFEADIGVNNGAKVYNNLLVNESVNGSCTGPWAYPPSGYIGWKGPNCGTGTGFYNNTIIGNSTHTNQPNLGILLEESCSGVTITNNIISTVGTFIVVNDASSSIVASGHNDFYNGNNDWNFQARDEPSFSAWQAACLCDTTSVTSNPSLTAQYKLQSGSPAIGLGANLTSMGIADLDMDMAGDPRPSTGTWDSGSYGLNGNGGNPPSPPTALSAMVQ